MDQSFYNIICNHAIKLSIASEAEVNVVYFDLEAEVRPHNLYNFTYAGPSAWNALPIIIGYRTSWQFAFTVMF